MNTLAEYIRIKRNCLGLSQKKLADKMNMAQGSVNNWEHSIGAPTIPNLKKLSEALETNHSELINLYNQYKKEIKQRKNNEFI